MNFDWPFVCLAPKEVAVLALLTLLAVPLSASEPAATDPIISPADFQTWFDAARAGRLSIPPQATRTARRFRYVFVGGFHNERMPGYFAQNAKELRARGAPRGAIHFIYPSSRESIAGNAKLVRSRFMEIASFGEEKLVVIAHSRGACDALFFALQNPEFIAEHVHSLFLIQGPFGGTGVADYVVGEGPPMDHRMPLGHRIIVHVLSHAEAYLMDHGAHGGLTSLTHGASEEFWSRALEEHRAALPIVGPRTYYVTSRTAPSQLRLLQRAAAWYLEFYFGPSDGMVTLEDQTVPGIGTVLAVLEAGHTDLTNRFPSASPRRRLRKALSDAIVMALWQSSGDVDKAE
jgi:pimeloyl-ACP methyl ester carboxylesterase